MGRKHYFPHEEFSVWDNKINKRWDWSHVTSAMYKWKLKSKIVAWAPPKHSRQTETLPKTNNLLHPPQTCLFRWTHYPEQLRNRSFSSHLSLSTMESSLTQIRCTPQGWPSSLRYRMTCPMVMKWAGSSRAMWMSTSPACGEGSLGAQNMDSEQVNKGMVKLESRIWESLQDCVATVTQGAIVWHVSAKEGSSSIRFPKSLCSSGEGILMFVHMFSWHIWAVSFWPRSFNTPRVNSTIYNNNNKIQYLLTDVEKLKKALGHKYVSKYVYIFYYIYIFF